MELWLGAAVIGIMGFGFAWASHLARSPIDTVGMPLKQGATT
jgi:hypothetical protein